MVPRGREAHCHQGNAAGDGAGHCGAQAEGLSHQLPADADEKSGQHRRYDSGLGGLPPEQGGKTGNTGSRRIEAPSEHENVVDVFNVQGDDQRAQRQDDGEAAGNVFSI